MTFRRLKANEIDCRVASKSKDGALMLLLYKDARVDQKLLDEEFGIYGWQRKHEVIGGNLYCTVSVQNPETGEWISKQDVGVESNTEKEKGQASDSFKRACFNLGIGRELYTAPQIWISKGNYTPNDKDSTYDRFSVTEIGYDKEGNINRLEIKNCKSKKVVFTYGVSKEKISGFPPRKEMIEVAKKFYPEGSEKLTELLIYFDHAESVEKLTDDQLKAIYSKYEGE